MAKKLKTLFRQTLEEEVSVAEGQRMTRRDAIVLAVIEKAMKGDLPSVNFIQALTEKKEDKRQKTGEEVIHVRVIKE